MQIPFVFIHFFTTTTTTKALSPISLKYIYMYNMNIIDL